MNKKKVSREWLDKKVYGPKKKRSIDLAKEAILILNRRNINITIQNIHEVSKEIDSRGKGLHRNTIRTNPEVYALYIENRTHQKIGRSNGQFSLAHRESYMQYLKHIKRDRDLYQVNKRYKRLTKQELINRLINCEQYVAETRDQWLFEQFQSEN
ncbi:hypothetical protein ABER68_24755 [Paenibacillus alvei]